MMIPNLIGVISLAPLVRKITRSYVNRRIKGIKEEPLLSFFPEINEQNAKKIAETGED